MIINRFNRILQKVMFFIAFNFDALNLAYVFFAAFIANFHALNLNSNIKP